MDNDVEVNTRPAIEKLARKGLSLRVTLTPVRNIRKGMARSSALDVVGHADVYCAVQIDGAGIERRRRVFVTLV